MRPIVLDTQQLIPLTKVTPSQQHKHTRTTATHAHSQPKLRPREIQTCSIALGTHPLLQDLPIGHQRLEGLGGGRAERRLRALRGLEESGIAGGDGDGGSVGGGGRRFAGGKGEGRVSRGRVYEGGGGCERGSVWCVRKGGVAGE